MGRAPSTWEAQPKTKRVLLSKNAIQSPPPLPPKMTGAAENAKGIDKTLKCDSGKKNGGLRERRITKNGRQIVEGKIAVSVELPQTRENQNLDKSKNKTKQRFVIVCYCDSSLLVNNPPPTKNSERTSPKETAYQ